MWLMNVPAQIDNKQKSTEKKLHPAYIIRFLLSNKLQKTFKKYTSHLFVLKPGVHTEFSFSTDASGYNQVSCFLPNITDD